jgi:hypothetical protein
MAKQIRGKFSDGNGRPKPAQSTNAFCCCPPKARVWIEVLCSSVFVENSIQIKRRFMTQSDAQVKPDIHVASSSDAAERVNAVAAANVAGTPQSAGDSMGAQKTDAHGDSFTKVDAGSDGKTEVDEFVEKNQGKVYRTDKYTIHWQADGEGDLQVSLNVAGALNYSADWLPASGSVTVSRNFLLEPPNYAPGDPGAVTATVSVKDCMGQSAKQTNRSATP